ncbi:MAG: YaaC family protein [Planctomycetota bacterium]|jgi:hypothetical protein
MPKLPKPREGENLRIKNYIVPFSFWPTRKTKTRSILSTRVFANDPWPIITSSIKQRIASDSKRLEALAYCEQSQDFFRSAQIARVSAAKPILLYYAFMNLAKAFILLKGVRPSLSNAYHGLKNVDTSQSTLTAAKLEAHKDKPGTKRANVFDAFFYALHKKHVPTNIFTYNLRDIIPQVVVGHRLWLEAMNSKTRKNHKERFVSVHSLYFMHDRIRKELWVNIKLIRSALTRFNYGVSDFINKADKGNWTAVSTGTPSIIRYDQKKVVRHSGSPADRLSEITENMKTVLWQTVKTNKPYTKFYLYAPPSQNKQVLPQLLSIYAIMFYLGSITRYRPLWYDDIVDSEFGTFVEYFIDSQPTQFLYLMASYFAEREVAKAAIV